MKAKNKPHQVKASEGPRRDEKGRILPGGTANPGGQPKWVKAIRDSLETAASDGAALVHAVIKGEPVTVTNLDGEQIEVRPTIETRLKAADIALSYTVPKATTRLEVSGNPERPLSSLTTEDILKALRG